MNQDTKMPQASGILKSNQTLSSSSPIILQVDATLISGSFPSTSATRILMIFTPSTLKIQPTLYPFFFLPKAKRVYHRIKEHQRVHSTCTVPKRSITQRAADKSCWKHLSKDIYFSRKHSSVEKRPNELQ